MFTVEGIPILVNEIEVLEKLKYDLTVRGIYRFNKIKRTGKNIMTTCPFHSNGQEKRPSFGISTENNLCHCFSCEYSGTLEEVISKVFGYNDFGEYGKNWLKKNFLNYNIYSRPKISFDRRNKVNSVKDVGFTEKELEEYRYVHPYVTSRGISSEVIDMFDVGYDFNTDCITFPCYYANNTPAFIIRRSVKGKLYSYPQNCVKPVYGAEKICRQEIKSVVICEGVFDALTCWTYGIPAVALLGLGSDYQYNVLKNMPVREYILGLDMDKVGRAASDRLKKILSGSKLVYYYEFDAKDINELGAGIKNLKKIL